MRDSFIFLSAYDMDMVYSNLTNRVSSDGQTTWSTGLTKIKLNAVANISCVKLAKIYAR